MTESRVVIRRVPEGTPRPEDFEIVDSPPMEVGPGQIRVRTEWLSLDPYVRALLSGRHFLRMPQPGDVLPARAVAQVVESRHDVWNVGDRLVLETGLQSGTVTDGTDAWPLHPGHLPASTALGILGTPGMTAYFGLLDVAQVQPGEIVLVSAASGPVGSMVGQIAKLRGARAIGLAGSKEKCDWVRKVARFEACIDYRSEDVDARLRSLAPDGVHVFFDNTGGTLQQIVIGRRHLARGARVVLCGLVAQYNLDEAPPGPNLGTLMASRAKILPLIVYDYEHRRSEFLREALAWHGEGRLVFKEDIVEGLQNAAAHFCRLMRGENFGKSLVHLQR
ncbi:MAG: NADP-dependent oxidoreductase [Sinobacteraceae bacterium]|nr:NADP-dependent oxidoreductase [Nevskiaceae bacterium]MCP5466893.1 NADP-dependent oxidoreductase [Nevskiaceae bacterium]